MKNTCDIEIYQDCLQSISHPDFAVSMSDEDFEQHLLCDVEGKENQVRGIKCVLEYLMFTGCDPEKEMICIKTLQELESCR